MRPEHLPPCAAAHLPSRGTRRTLANTTGTALCIALVLLLITGRTMRPLLSALVDEPYRRVCGRAARRTTPDAATLVQALEDGDWGRAWLPLTPCLSARISSRSRHRAGGRRSAKSSNLSEPQPDHATCRSRAWSACAWPAVSAPWVMTPSRCSAISRRSRGRRPLPYHIARLPLRSRRCARAWRRLAIVRPGHPHGSARVLGLLGYREAIPALQAALEDPYVSEGEDSLGTYTIYPVREQAAGALEALGVTVERDGDTFTVSP